MTAPWDDPRVQRGMKELFALRSERLAAGDKAIGWKVAFGGKGIQEKLGITAPLVGFLTQRQSMQSGDTISLAGWAKPIIEPEIAVYMGSDLAAGADRAATTAAIARLGPAYELLDSPVPPEDVEKVLAGNIAHRGVVLGATGAAAIEQMRGRVFRGENECAATDDVQAVPGDPRTLVAYVADYLAAFGENLRAGDVVICGSIVPPIPIEADDDSFRYALDPVGEVLIRFSR